VITIKRKPLLLSRPSLLAPVAVSLLCFACARDRAARIQVDFSSRQQWVYSFEANVKGEMASGDSLKQFFNSAQCLLHGSSTGTDHASLKLAVSDLVVFSNVLSDVETDNLKQQVSRLTLILSCSDGSLAPADSTVLPTVSLSGWDLYRTLARTIPSLPDGVVRRGYHWDREKQVPLQTTFGVAIGHLYQSFSVDSVVGSDKERMAYISWQFTYRIEAPASDSTAVLNLMPLSGKGQGRAAFNVAGRYLKSAAEEFTVPRPVASPVKLSWTESVGLSLRE
jgi:hypothetical protein